MSDESTILRAAVLDDERIVAGFSTRLGGVSAGPFEAMNLSAREDDPGAVAENLLRFCRSCGLDRCPPVVQRQVHGKGVTWVGENDASRPWALRELEGDALVTRCPGVPVAVQVADCVPILLWDPRQGVVAAVHAGWRGTALDIAGAVVAEMAERAGSRPGDLRAAVGPAICGDCYEVGPEVARALAEVLSPEEFLASGQGERERVDLRRANRALLAAAGLDPVRVELVGGCTYCDRDFYSYRRDGPRTGRQMGVIQLR